MYIKDEYYFHEIPILGDRVENTSAEKQTAQGESIGRLADIEGFIKHPTTRFCFLCTSWFGVDRLAGSPFFPFSLAGLAFGFALYRGGIPAKIGWKRYIGLFVYGVIFLISVFCILGVFKQADINGTLALTVAPEQKLFGQLVRQLGLTNIDLMKIWIALPLAGIFDWLLVTSSNEKEAQARAKIKKVKKR